jgi:hypothetical protein
MPSSLDVGEDAMILLKPPWKFSTHTYPPYRLAEVVGVEVSTCSSATPIFQWSVQTGKPVGWWAGLGWSFWIYRGDLLLTDGRASLGNFVLVGRGFHPPDRSSPRTLGTFLAFGDFLGFWVYKANACEWKDKPGMDQCICYHRGGYRCRWYLPVSHSIIFTYRGGSK